MKKTGIELIVRERNEQLTKHQISVKQDVKNNSDNQLANVASILCCPDYDIYDDDGELLDLEEFCPFNWNVNHFLKMIKKPYKERLSIAGALIAAEIDRLNYEQK